MKPRYANHTDGARPRSCGPHSSRSGASEIAPLCAWHDRVHGLGVRPTVCAPCAEEQMAAFEAAHDAAVRTRARRIEAAWRALGRGPAFAVRLP